MRLCSVGWLVAGWLTVVSLPAAVPQNPQEPVFRGGVTFVNVDAYPRRDGHLVEGLRAEDFQVLEDGKPQKIDAFEFIRIAPNAPDAQRLDPNTKEEGDKLAADPHNRVFVFYLDLFHMTFGDAGSVRGPIVEFLGRTIAPNDLFGVVTPRTPDPVSQLVLAKRTDALEADLARWVDDWVLVTRDTPIEFQLTTCTGDEPLARALVHYFREDLMWTGLEDLMSYLRGLRDERKNLVLVTEGWVPGKPAEILLNVIQPTGAPRMGPGPGTGRLGVGVPQPGTVDHSWCNQQAGHLASIDWEQRFRDLLKLANQANVAFYPVDVGGLRASSPLTGTVNTLRTLAENTDGMAIVNTNDLNAGFRRIADDLSGYYLLGYSSTNQNLDGKYREIKVKISQPGVSVTARHGYLAPSAESRAAAAAKASAAAVPATVAEELARLSRVRTDTELLTYGVRSSTGIDVVTEISSREVARGRWNDGADVRVVLNRTNGENVTASGRIEPAARGTIVHLPLADGDTGPWAVSVLVSQAGASLEDRADVPLPAPSDLVGAPIVFRGTAAGRVPLRPVADFTFRRNERLRVEWPALKPLDQRTARLLDRKGQPLALSVTVTESARAPREASESAPAAGAGVGPRASEGTPAGARASGDGAPLAVKNEDSGATIINADLTLAPLAEGDYLMELTAGAGGQTERRLLAFRVVR